MARRRKPNDPEPPREEQVVRLEDGRGLGVAEFGEPEGRAIFWFHGTPGARRQIPPHARHLARERGLRLIGVERPGVGWSTPHVYGSVLEFAHDVEELTDLLEVEAFGAVGLSGGGPYVLACAHHMPDRMVAAAVFGGVAPTSGEDAVHGGPLRATRHFHPLMNLWREPLGLFLSAGIRALHPLADQVFDFYLRVGPEGDREVLDRPDMRAMFIDDLLTGSREGLRSVVYDVLLFMRPWGFSLRDVDVPTHFWQGDSDVIDASEEAIDFILSHWPQQRP
jgi:pimeloyl-ACP methyl ester carboxylesterase